MKPLVDINIAVYNHARYLKQTLDSVLAQETSFPFRLIIGDDCSTDGSVEILKQYEALHPEKIKVIYQPKNIGFTGRETNGMIILKSSTAKYIALLDGDDYWADPLKLQKQVDFLEKHPEYAICATQAFVKTGERMELSDLYASQQEESFSIVDLAKNNFIHTPSVVFRNELLGKLPAWFGSSPVGDYVIYMLVARYGLIKWFPEPMAVYRKHQTSTWSTQSMATSWSRFLTVIDLLLTEDFAPDVREQLIQQKRSIANKYLTNVLESGNMQAFKKGLQSYVLHDPVLAEHWLLDGYPDFIDRLRNSASFRAANAVAKFKARLFPKK